MKIEIEKYGILQNSSYKGWYVYIQNDNPYYYILIFNSLDQNFGEGYDYWVEDYNNLVTFLNSTKWEIGWLDLDIPPPYDNSNP